MCTCVRRVAGDDGALSDSARKAGNSRYRSWNVGGGGAAFPLGRAPPAAVGGHLASLKGRQHGGRGGGGAGQGAESAGPRGRQSPSQLPPSGPGGSDEVQGWRLRPEGARPQSAGRV